MISAKNMTRVAWTSGAYGTSQLFRLVTNVVLARLLSPELLGIMLIVNTLRTGIDLITDVGTGQNIVTNKSAEDPNFYNTAWTVQFARGLFLYVLTLALAPVLAHFYGSPTLLAILPVAGLYFVLHGSASVGPYLLQKRLHVPAISKFEVAVAAVSAIAHIVLALITPTVWALVFGGIVTAMAYCLFSYLVMPGPRPHFQIDRTALIQLFTFGKWVFASSMVYFLSMNVDRLFLGKVVTLEALGVYGIARSLADVLNTLINRLCTVILFPLVASTQGSRSELRAKLARARPRILLLAMLGISGFAAVSDQLVYLLYDQRYQAAAWMLPVLAVAVWFSLLAGLADAVLLGIARPAHTAMANTAKLVWLAIGLPLAIGSYGLAGAVCVVATGELVRYAPLLISQAREHLCFPAQDLVLTVAMFGMTIIWRIALHAVGLVPDLSQLWAIFSGGG